MTGVLRSGYIDHCLRWQLCDLRVLPVGGIDTWIVRWKDGPTEYWVPPMETKTSYSTLFRAFLRDEFEINFDAENAKRTERFQIDHAHCSVSVRENADAHFVLLTPLEGRTNASWGSIERALAHAGYRGGPEAVCNWLTMGKLLGVRPPRYAQRTDPTLEAARYAARLAEAGLAVSRECGEEIEGVIDLIGQARRGAARNRKRKERHA